MNTGPRGATVVWHAVQICARAAADLKCRIGNGRTSCLKLDSQNSEVWIRVALTRYGRGDTAQALDALQRAATAAETRDYWPETVEMLERALDSAGGYSFPERAVSAIGFAAASLHPYGPYVDMCRKQSEIDAEWAQACLEYGRLVERQGKTEIGLSIAQIIQIAALEGMGNAEAAQFVAARRDEAARSRSAEAVDLRGDFFLVSNPRLFATYLAALRERGERAAVIELRAEVKRLAELCSQRRGN